MAVRHEPRACARLHRRRPRRTPKGHRHHRRRHRTNGRADRQRARASRLPDQDPPRAPQLLPGARRTPAPSPTTPPPHGRRTDPVPASPAGHRGERLLAACPPEGSASGVGHLGISRARHSARAAVRDATPSFAGGRGRGLACARFVHHPPRPPMTVQTARTEPATASPTGLRRRLLPFTGLIPVVLMVPVLAFDLYGLAIVLALVSGAGVIAYHVSRGQGVSSLDLILLAFGAINAVLYFGFDNA